MKRKKKLYLILSVLVLLFIGVLFLIIFKTDFFSSKDSSFVTRQKTESELLEEKGVILVNKESFVKDANSLLEKGYSAQEINQIYEYMSDSNFRKILDSDYVDLKEFYPISNFDFDKIERYKAYQTLEGISISDAVTRVNLKLDLPFYSDIEKISEPDSLLALVNKANALPSDYVPLDLVPIPSFPNLQLRDDAIDDFEKLLSAAKLDNVFLIPYSTYRSYDYQDGLYNKYLNTDPKEVVDTYSARPGHSEHQTGLALDVRSSSHWYNLTDEDYKWMLDNSYKYGFIIRYPKDNSSITGYKEEPWHIRYIGVDDATKVHEEGITFDEYYDLFLSKH